MRDRRSREAAVLGALLKRLRTDRRMSVSELADEMDRPVPDVEAWESGAYVPDLFELREICGALGASVEAFLDRFERAVREL